MCWPLVVVHKGNALRPDSVNKVCSTYFGLLGLPAYFRNSEHGWFPVACIRTDTISAVRGGVSGFMKHLMHFMFMGSDNILKGFMCEAAGVARFAVKCELVGIIADELCHKQLRSLKGASGLRMCGACVNIVHTQQPHRLRCDDFLRWQATAFPKDFVRMTDANAFEICDELAAAAPLTRKTAFEKMEKEYGANHAPHGLVADTSLRGVYKPVSHTLYDYMHCILASTGIGQYHVNGFLHAVASHTHFTMEDIDAFAWNISFGKRNVLGYLKKDFFSSRCAASPTGHIKAFASETLSAVCVLRFFCIVKLDPASLLPNHSRAMHLLAKICGIFSLGDAAVPLVDELSRLLELHHREVLSCYGAALCKPKNHLTYHCTDILRNLGVCLSCFSNERRNRLLCAAVPHNRGRAAVDEGPLFRLLLDLEHRVQVCSFEPYSMVEPCVDVTSTIRGLFDEEPARVRLADSVRTPSGQWGSRQYIWVRDVLGSDTICFTECFVELLFSDDLQSVHIFAIAQVYRQCVARRAAWEPAGFSMYLCVDKIAGVVPGMFLEGGLVMPLFPEYL